MPAVHRQRLPGLDAKSVVQPALGQVDLQLAVDEVDAVTIRSWFFWHSRQDGPVRASRLDPEREREAVVEPEVADVAGVGEALAVEVECPADAAVRECPGAVADSQTVC